MTQPHVRIRICVNRYDFNFVSKNTNALPSYAIQVAASKISWHVGAPKPDRRAELKTWTVDFVRSGAWASVQSHVIHSLVAPIRAILLFVYHDSSWEGVWRSIWGRTDSVSRPCSLQHTCFLVSTWAELDLLIVI